MRRALASEWYKLWRRGMVLGILGSMAAVCVLAVILVFANAKAPGSAPPPGPGGGEQGLPTTEALAKDGFTRVFQFSGGLLGVISLVLFAQALGSEYREGTLKVLLSREPRRLVLLAGKLVALGAFLAVAILSAFAIQTLAALLMAGARGISTSAWWTASAWQNAAGLVARMWVADATRGLLGAALAILLRSSASAIGVGVGYLLVGEGIVSLVWKDATRWLPNFVLGTFTGGGTAAQPLADASLLVAGYAIVFAAVCAVVFRQRDVTS